jgi:hypothetical protein
MTLQFLKYTSCIIPLPDVFYCWGETNCILLSNYTRKFGGMLAFSKKKRLWNGHVAPIRKKPAYRMMVGKTI